ncbi:MAG: transcription termination/antitermination NusG family protein [Chloroflexota bacterium]
MLGWWVAKTKPQKERFVTTFLAMWNVETFLPMIVRPTSRTGAMEPLFPSYVFCRMEPQSPIWPVARWAPGVSYFLSADGQPTEIAESLIEHLQDRVQRWNGGGVHHRWTPGDSVPVVSGPFAGIDGIFKSYLPARQRCEVLLEVVGKIAVVELPEWNVGDPLRQVS